MRANEIGAPPEGKAPQISLESKSKDTKHFVESQEPSGDFEGQKIYMTKVSLFDGISPQEVGQITVEQALNRIRDGESKSLIERIRNGEKQLKTGLPGVTWGGLFSHRSRDRLTDSTGLACIDIDHVQNPTFVKQELFNKYPEVLAAYISPSGDGVKALIRIPKVNDDTEYKQYYHSITGTIPNCDKTDDISRLAFESYDPDILTRDWEETSTWEDKTEPETPPEKPSEPPQSNIIKIDPKILEGIKNAIQNARDGDKHNTLLRCANTLGGYIGNGITNHEAEAFLSEEIQQRDIESLDSALQTIRDGLQNGMQKPLIHEFLIDRISITDEIDEGGDCITIQGRTVGRHGGMTVISGAAKSRKTHAAVAAAAGGLSGKPVAGITVTLSQNKTIVLYIDAEQPRKVTQNTVRKIIQAAGMPTDADPENLFVVNLRKYSPKDRINKIELALRCLPNIGLVILDGTRDITLDINDNGQAQETISKLLKWTDENQFHLINILHTNKGDNNARGHLGTELVNKSDAHIQVKKDERNPDISIVKAEHMRELEFDPFAIGHDADGCPTMEGYEVPDREAGKRKEKPEDYQDNWHWGKINHIWLKDTHKRIPYSELIRQVKGCTGKGEIKAKEIVSYWKNNNWITQPDGQKTPYKYSLDDTPF